MVRPKEEGEHFKRLQSIRGHFQAMLELLFPSNGIQSMSTENENLLWFCRSQHPSLFPSNQLSQPQNAQSNIQPPSSFTTGAQPQPSAPPSSSFTPLPPSMPATPFSPSMPSGHFPQDPRLPSLYLPSYDEAVNMQ